jgi:hypothetical protein
VAAVGAQNLDERREWTAEGSDQWHSAVQSLLHELGHCLGAHHDHDQGVEGDQHPGMARVEGDEYRYTPTVFGGGVENRCGEWVPAEPDGAAMVRVHEYSDCAIEVFEEEMRKRQ